MKTIVIGKKKYVPPRGEPLFPIAKKAASKTPSARQLALAEGKKLAHSLIDKWHNRK